MSENKLKPGRPTLTYPEDAPNYPTMIHALAEAVKRAPDRPALICEDLTLTYRDYARAVGGLAGELRKLGVGKDKRTAIMMGNSIEMAVAIFGTMAAGGQAALMNPNYTDRELTPLLKDADPTVILCNAPHIERAKAQAKAAGIPHVAVLGEGGLRVEDWVDDASLNLPEPFPSADDLAIMFFTGGTTGLPKGADHRHSMLVSFCRQIYAFLDTEFDKERSLSVAPMFHIFGLNYSVLLPLYLRGAHVLVKQYKPDIVLEQLSRHKITTFGGGPSAIYVGLLACDKFDGADLSALRYSISGGAPCSEDLLKNWQDRTGGPLIEGCGMSEGAPIANNVAKGKRKFLSVGLVPPETEIDIVDLETGQTVLPVNQRGEIRVKGPQFIKGYRNRPEETAAAIRDGWLYTGDIGYFDEEGYLYLVDRKKELIITGGFNVYPREIDEVLSNHPDTIEVATVGVPDSFKGEAVKAFVVLKSGAKITADDLIEYCKTQLTKYKVPSEIEILAALPKTGPGKIDKLALKGQR